ncbi:MAG TPA: ribonuclease activity regulator RraA [Candidatus Sulfotelmatobacter sp.]|nr:ribonuclease activity regulator RraA [Candidatus Sulfotelmatobacter sp.]
MKPLSDATTHLLKHVSTATLTTQLFRRGFRNVFMQGITPLGCVGNDNLVGPAFTLRNIPAREDIDVLDIFLDPENPQRKGVESVPPGHVLVQDCRGDRTAASCGSILVTRMKVRGAAGMVSDGPVRDSGVIAAMGFPVFCAGASAPTNIIKHHSVDLNLPIGCGGVAVYPGDIIVGDIDGVVVIPRSLAEELAVDAADQERMEEFIKLRVEAGAPLRGTYPPNDETKKAYLAWKSQNVQQS